MTVECVACRRFSFRGDKPMAEIGFGRCALERQTGRFVSPTYPRNCADFVQAEAQAENERRRYLGSLRFPAAKATK